jgi:hypothetical protein
MVNPAEQYVGFSHMMKACIIDAFVKKSNLVQANSRRLQEAVLF